MLLFSIIKKILYNSRTLAFRNKVLEIITLLKQKNRFRKDFSLFKDQCLEKNIGSPEWKDRMPCLNDRTGITTYEPHYTYHLAWAARMLQQIKPEYHVDISSSISFATICSAFVPIKFFDYRPLQINLSNLSPGEANLLNLPFADNSIISLSCMHVIEHIGLGRYGDEIDVNGDRKAIAELIRVLQVGGYLLLVFPMGKPRIQFNAHRIYSYDQAMQYLKPLSVKRFEFVPDDFQRHGLLSSPEKGFVDKQKWGCGCFLLTKLER